MRLIAVAVVSLFAIQAPPAASQMPKPLPAEAIREAPDPAKVAYLESHIVARGPVEGQLAFQFPPSFFLAQLYLVGESHGSAAPHLLDLQLLALLNEKRLVRDYLAEMDPLQASYINTYLQTGDERALDRVFDGWRDSFAQWGSVSYRDKVRGVRILNQKLPADRRIRFHGLDRIQDWGDLANWLTAAGASIDRSALASAKTNAAKATLALAALPAARMSADLRADLEASLQLTAARTNREDTIFRTYKRLVEGPLKGRPAYGMWGLFHVIQQPIKDAALPFAAQVRRSGLPGADTLQSLILVPLDSAVQVPIPLPTGTKRMRMTVFNVDGPFVKLQGSASLRAATQPGQTTVFQIAAPGSPYAEGQDLTRIVTSVGQDILPADSKMTEPFAQYIGVYRNSDWATPLDAGPMATTTDPPHG
jgi:hypothetical protein